jgi:hypothetical protein
MSKFFWLGDSAWPFPDHENAEALVERLLRPIAHDQIAEAMDGAPARIATVRGPD